MFTFIHIACLKISKKNPKQTYISMCMETNKEKLSQDVTAQLKPVIPSRSSAGFWTNQRIKQLLFEKVNCSRE